ncbi:unnamed protein product, partial [Protopolystoma xenopodis]
MWLKREPRIGALQSCCQVIEKAARHLPSQAGLGPSLQAACVTLWNLCLPVLQAGRLGEPRLVACLDRLLRTLRTLDRWAPPPRLRQPIPFLTHLAVPFSPIALTSLPPPSQHASQTALSGPHDAGPLPGRGRTNTRRHQTGRRGESHHLPLGPNMTYLSRDDRVGKMEGVVMCASYTHDHHHLLLLIL